VTDFRAKIRLISVGFSETAIAADDSPAIPRTVPGLSLRSLSVQRRTEMPSVIAAAYIDVIDKWRIEERPVGCVYEGEAVGRDRRVPAGQVVLFAHDARFFHHLLPGRMQPIGVPGGAA